MPDLIKVLIVEDSPTVSQILTSLISSDATLQVVGVATNGAEAIRLTSRHRPNIITMDVNMPQMSGMEATEYIMAHQPTPILVLTAFSKQDVNLSLNMLSAGALEIMEKPDADQWQNRKERILDRLKLLSRIKVITHVRGKQRVFQDKPGENHPELIADPHRQIMPLRPENPVKAFSEQSTVASAPRPPEKTLAQPTALPPKADHKPLTGKYEIVGIAASTGGPPALSRLLGQLPANFPVPIFVVQHIPAGFSSGLADWLDGETPLKVKLAEEDEVPQPGFVYLPADDRHLTFWSDGRLHLDESPSRYGLRPSADLTFESMAQVWPGKTLSVMLTGMGRDGSQGMRSLNQAGGYNIAQDEASSVIFGMPKAAIDLGIIDKVLPLLDIAGYLKQIFRLA